MQLWFYVAVALHTDIDFNFKSNMDKLLIYCKVLDEITHPFSNFDGETVEVWE